MKILSIDCSATPASVAIVDDDKILGFAYTNVGLTHSQTLVPMIYSTLENSQISLFDIDCFAINSGPGSFTGVRIGVAALKGICGLDEMNCISVSTLESMAYNYLGVSDCIVCAAMDARCNQVYTATFKVSDGLVTRLSDDVAVMIPELENHLKSLDVKFEESGNFSDIVFVGDGAALCYNTLAEKLPGVKIAPSHLLYQNAVSVARAANKKIISGEMPVSGEEILPTYLRAPQAERELRRNLK